MWVWANAVPLMLLGLIPTLCFAMWHQIGLSDQRAGRIAVLELKLREMERGDRGDRWRLHAQMKGWARALGDANAGLVVPDPEDFAGR
jgi:hypothetical protein